MGNSTVNGQLSMVNGRRQGTRDRGCCLCSSF